LNPFKDRSPGPLYDVRQNIGNHTISFGKSSKFSNEKIISPSSTYYEPNYDYMYKSNNKISSKTNREKVYKV